MAYNGNDRPRETPVEQGDADTARALDAEQVVAYADCLDQEALAHQIDEVQTKGEQKGFTRASVEGVLDRQDS